MKISKQELRRIVLEEFMLEEGIETEALSPEKFDQMMKNIKSNRKGSRPVPPPPEVPRPKGKGLPHEDTMPMDIPADDAPESEYQGFQNDAGADIETQLASLIHGMDPEAVAELFQTVFEKIPGIEMQQQEPDAKPSTEYGGEEFELRQRQGRVAGIKEVLELGDLMALIREVIKEEDNLKNV